VTIEKYYRQKSVQPAENFHDLVLARDHKKVADPVLMLKLLLESHQNQYEDIFYSNLIKTG